MSIDANIEHAFKQAAQEAMKLPATTRRKLFKEVFGALLDKGELKIGYEVL